MSMSPTYTGFVKDTRDALFLFQAVIENQLCEVSRRPHDKEKGDLIRSGSIFIFNEQSSGIKRWTDNMHWSPSRILGNFLVYRELNQPPSSGEKRKTISRKVVKTSSIPSAGDPAANAMRGKYGELISQNQPPIDYSPYGREGSVYGYSHTHAPMTTSHSSTTNDLYGDAKVEFESGQQSHPVGGMAAYDLDGHLVSRSSVSSASSGSGSSTAGGPAGGSSPLSGKAGSPIERALVGSLVNSYNFKNQGLMKKTISVTYQGSPYHLVSYYKPDDVTNEHLQRPSEDPAFKNMKLYDELIQGQNFRTSLDHDTALEMSSGSNVGSIGMGTQHGLHFHSQHLAGQILGPDRMLYGQSIAAPQMVQYDSTMFGPQGAVPIHGMPGVTGPPGAPVPAINGLIGLGAMSAGPINYHSNAFGAGSSGPSAQISPSTAASSMYQNSYVSKYKPFGSATTSLPIPHTDQLSHQQLPSQSRESQDQHGRPQPRPQQEEHQKLSQQNPSHADPHHPQDQLQTSSQQPQAQQSQQQQQNPSHGSVAHSDQYGFDQTSRRSSLTINSPSLPPLLQSHSPQQYQYYGHDYNTSSSTNTPPSGSSNPREVPSWSGRYTAPPRSSQPQQGGGAAMNYGQSQQHVQVSSNLGCPPYSVAQWP